MRLGLISFQFFLLFDSIELEYANFVKIFLIIYL